MISTLTRSSAENGQLAERIKETSMDTETKLQKTLLIAGASLFLIGLLSGIAVQLTENLRMGLSAHLAGVQNALFLLVIGATWDHIRLQALLQQ